jgi:gamma-glutamyltranspeptidase/glutathione hydrolase
MLADQGPAALYEGEVGARLVADLQAHGGDLRREDLAAYTISEHRPPIGIEYRGYQLTGLSRTSGSMTAFEVLNILSNFDLAALAQGSADSLHLIAEACRRAFWDRFTHVTDPDFLAVPADGLLSRDYAAALASTIALDRADRDVVAADPWRFAPVGAGSTGRVGASVAGADGCTTHLNVVDADRNMVSMTSTLGDSFGSAVVAQGTGIVLNNGMTWFDPEPGHVNSIQPRKRCLWAPAPTVVVREGRPYLAVGAPGGRRIISAVVQSLVNMLDYGLGVQAAVSTPRLHCEGPLTEIDSNLPSETIADLAARGHTIMLSEEHTHPFRFARPSGIRIDPETNELTAGVYQYTPAWAMGY